MKIIVVNNSALFTGGEEKYTELLSSLLRKHKHIVYDYRRDSKEIISIKDTLLSGINLFWNRSLYTFEQKIHQLKPDIVHFNNIYPLINPTAYHICNKYHIPIIQSIHSYRLLCPKGFLFRKSKICEECVIQNSLLPSIKYGCYHNSRLASLIFASAMTLHRKVQSFNLISQYIFPTEFTMNYHLKYLNLNPSKTNVVPYYLDTVQQKTVNRQKYFLFVGRLSEEKGVRELVNIFDRKRNLKLKILGSGPLGNGLKKLTFKYDIELLGKKSPKVVTKLMLEASAVIIASQWFEVLPFVFIESLKLKSPVFVPDNENFTQIVGHLNKNMRSLTHFYKFNDFQDLKNRLTSFGNTTQFSEIRNSNNNDATIDFEPKKHYERIIRIYQKAIRNP